MTVIPPASTTPPAPDPDQGPLGVALRAAVDEVERYVDDGGWDQPRQLFALVPTAELLAHEPGLLGQLGGDSSAKAAVTEPEFPALTPVEQGEIPGDSIADALTKIAWPAEIVGCILVLEIMVGGGGEPAEGRLAVGVLRDLSGGACAARWRHAPHGPVTRSADLAPELIEALHATFEP